MKHYSESKFEVDMVKAVLLILILRRPRMGLLLRHFPLWAGSFIHIAL